MKTTKSFFSTVALIAAVLGSVAIIGCSDSTTTPATPNKPITPKVGSTYQFRQHERDSTAGKPATIIDTVLTVTIVRSGDTLAGMTGVVTAISTLGDTEVYAFDANGDLNVYIPYIDASLFTLQMPAPWFRVPTFSKATSLALGKDTSNVQISGYPGTVYTTATSGYLGEETDSLIASPTISGGKAKLDVRLDGSVLVVQATATGQRIFAVDPNIGMYFHQRTEFSTPAIMTISATNKVVERWLVAYTVIK
ncbi:MAG: hypothetical protein JSS75_07660 [Bacteroidetes bacterium]|nr:hypothetical protein [Bacteroidota bacterium]